MLIVAAFSRGGKGRHCCTEQPRQCETAAASLQSKLLLKATAIEPESSFCLTGPKPVQCKGTKFRHKEDKLLICLLTTHFRSSCFVTLLQKRLTGNEQAETTIKATEIFLDTCLASTFCQTLTYFLSFCVCFLFFTPTVCTCVHFQAWTFTRTSTALAPRRV